MNIFLSNDQTNFVSCEEEEEEEQRNFFQEEREERKFEEEREETKNFVCVLSKKKKRKEIQKKRKTFVPLSSLSLQHTQLTFVLLFPLPYSFYTRTRTTEY